VFAIVLLLRPADADAFLDPLGGAERPVLSPVRPALPALASPTGTPTTIPEGDAREVAQQLQPIRQRPPRPGDRGDR
jgi:hypothetical protein